MNQRGDPGNQGAPARRASMSKKTSDLGKNLLSSLFMAIRTAKIHDPSNEAFENAVQSVFRSATALFSATGGFSVQLVEDSVFLNGERIRFESSAFSTMRTLRRLMEAEGLGGLELMHPPNQPAIRKLVMLFAPGARSDDATARAELAQDIKMLGVQRVVDDRQDIKVDRRVFAVQCYGKLVLAVREQIDRIAQARACDWASNTAPPRLRLVRVVQDLVELGADRADFLLRLSTNTTGATPVELHGANTCLLAIVMGHALGVPRQDLVDVAVAALFHHIGAPVDAQGNFRWRPVASQASLARLLAESGVGHSSYLRALIVGEQPLVVPPDAPVRPHPYARLVKVVATYDQLTTGFGIDEAPLHPLAALARLYNEDPAAVDRDLVDLLINVMRAYPVGARVILDTSEVAVVQNQLGGARWDRPTVEVQSDPPRLQDLSLREGGRFINRIASTARFAGHDVALEGPLDEHAVPHVGGTTDLADLLVGEDVFADDDLPLDPASDLSLDDGAAPWDSSEDALGAPTLDSSQGYEHGFDDPNTQPSLHGIPPMQTEPVDPPPDHFLYDAPPPLPETAFEGPPSLDLQSEARPEGAARISADTLHIDEHRPQAELHHRGDPPSMNLPDEESFGALIPEPASEEAFPVDDLYSGTVEQSVLDRLGQVPGSHTDTFDEEDIDDTHAGEPPVE